MKRNIKWKVVCKMLCFLVLIGCVGESDSSSNSTELTPVEETYAEETIEEGATEEPTEEPTEEFPGVRTITPSEAKEIMDSEEGYILLDVRTEEEFLEGYIEGAILIPYDEIDSRGEELTNKTATILVYCRSGRRSAIAAQALVDMGFANVYDFGGIIDWPY